MPSGSVPGPLPDDIYQRTLSRLDGRGILTAVDAIRDLVCDVLSYRPSLIKPSNFELGEIFGRTLGSDEDIVGCARQFQEQGARNALVSMAEDGSVLLD